MRFWTLSLGVELDRERRVLTPSIRVDGGSPFARGIVSVTLVDPDGKARVSERRPFLPSDIGAELALDPLVVPDGAAGEDALRWAWDIAVHTDGLERIRWRRYLEIGTRVGPDAEIHLAGPLADLATKAEDEGWGPEAPWDERDSDRLLAALVAAGIITEAVRTSMLALARSKGKTVERILVDEGHLGEREMLTRYAEVSGCEILDLDHYPIDPEIAGLIPEGTVRRDGMIAVGRRGELVVVAASDPQSYGGMIGMRMYIDWPYIALATRAEVMRALGRMTAER